MNRDRGHPFTCRLCGLEHQEVVLAPGETARCVRCSTRLARRGRLGPDASLAFTLTGLALGAVALMLPLVRVRELGNVRECMLYSGAIELTRAGMGPLASLVFFSGVVSPALLLCSLLALVLPPRLGMEGSHLILRKIVAFLTEWSYPEVQLLALLVGFIKLANIVEITARPGLWCYGAMSLAILLAYRSFEFDMTVAHSAVRPEAIAIDS